MLLFAKHRGPPCIEAMSLGLVPPSRFPKLLTESVDDLNLSQRAC